MARRRRSRRTRKPKNAHALIVKLAEEMCKKKEWKRTNPRTGYCLELTRFYCSASDIKKIAKEVAKAFPEEVADEDPIRFVKKRLVDIKVIEKAPCEEE